jgi:hypothetical protein
MPRQTCTAKSAGVFVNPAEQAHGYAKNRQEKLTAAAQIQPENEGLRAISQAS